MQTSSICFRSSTRFFCQVGLKKYRGSNSVFVIVCTDISRVSSCCSEQTDADVQMSPTPRLTLVKQISVRGYQRREHKHTNSWRIRARSSTPHSLMSPPHSSRKYPRKQLHLCITGTIFVLSSSCKQNGALPEIWSLCDTHESTEATHVILPKFQKLCFDFRGFFLMTCERKQTCQEPEQADIVLQSHYMLIIIVY